MLVLRNHITSVHLVEGYDLWYQVFERSRNMAGIFSSLSKAFFFLIFLAQLLKNVVSHVIS